MLNIPGKSVGCTGFFSTDTHLVTVSNACPIPLCLFLQSSWKYDNASACSSFIIISTSSSSLSNVEPNRAFALSIIVSITGLSIPLDIKTLNAAA